MYLSYYNFNCKPFDLVPNPEFIYLSRTHKRAITYLEYGIKDRAGFVLLTGEVGSGKTTIIREIIEKHLKQGVLAKVINTNANSEQLLAMINDDFDLPVHGKDKIALMRDLNHFLVDQFSRGNKPVLIVDEAQNLSAETLEEIRMLSNLETSESKLLQIILVGQPELRSVLAQPQLRQLRQRINIQCHLQPLNRQETEEYVFHRMQVAGNRDALRFSAEAFDIIFTYTCGIPRLINIITDFLLLAAFAERITQVDKELVQDTISDLDFKKHYWAVTPPLEVDNTSHDTVMLPVQCMPQPTDSQLDELFERLSRRLESFEHDTVSSTVATLKGFDRKLEQMQQDFLHHLDVTARAIAGLNSKLEALGRIKHDPPPPVDDSKDARCSLIRRFFS